MQSRDTHSSEDDAHDDLVSIGVAARILGVSVETVRRWDNADHIASCRTVGGQRRFRRGALERLAETTTP